MRSVKFHFGLLILLVLIPLTVCAQKETQKPGDVVHLDEMVVTSSRVREKKRDVTANVSIIDEYEIKNSTATNVGDLLAEKGIGHIQKYPGALTAISIRGFSTEFHGNDLKGHVLVLVNGRRAGTGNLAKILTANVERIEIIRGPASVQYGSAAVGGVINIITKRGKGTPSLSLAGKLGSFNYREGDVGISGKVKNVDFSTAFTASAMDDYDTGSGEKYKNTGYDSEYNFNLNTGLEFLPGNRVGFTYNYFDSNNVGNPGYLKRNDLDDYTEKSYRTYDITYEGGIKDSPFTWSARYFWGRDQDKWYDPTGSNPDFWDDGIPAWRNTDQQGVQAQLTVNKEKFLVTGGFDWVDYKIDASWEPKETEYDNPAGFFLTKIRLFNEELILSGGLRYDYYRVKVDKPSSGSEDDDNVSLRFGLAYLPIRYVKLRFNYGEAFVMPSADQMSANYFIWGTHYVGNPNLDPETSRTYEGGIDFSYGAFDSSFTIFHTDFDDKIESVVKPGWIKTWENKGGATIDGIEADLSFDIGAQMGWDFGLKPYFGIVYLTRYRDEETDSDLKYVSQSNLSYGITLSGLYGFNANLNFAYMGKQDIEDWESGVWPVPLIEKGGFTVADFSVEKTAIKTEKYGTLTLRGEVKNLLDKNYSYVKGYPMPGRSVYVELKYTY